MSDDPSDDDVTLENESIGRRLRKEIEGKLTIVAAADLAKVTPKTMQRWLKGESSVDMGAVNRICREIGANPIYILTGLSDESGDWETNLPPARTGEKRIPLRDIAVSAGHGMEVFRERPSATFTFPLKWLLKMGNPDSMDILRVEGDSMEPELADGDHVMIDRSQRQAKDGLFVVLVEEHLFLKRVRMRGRGRAELVSTNPAYTPFEISLPEPDDEIAQDAAAVVGRVIWMGREVR